MYQRILNQAAMHQEATAAVLLCASILFPCVCGGSSYIMNIAVLALVYAVLALSLNLVTGFLGTTTLGHAAFFGIGAYTAAILATKHHVPFLLTLPASAAVSAVFGILLGLITLRVSGKYLAIVTLGFCEIARLLELNWYSLTRGPLGIMNIPSPKIFGFEFDTITGKYGIILVILLMTIIIAVRVTNSRVGRAITAIKCDGLAANVMGINVRSIKVAVFVLSSALAGMAGGFYSHYISFIDPNTFNYNKSVQILSMAILGGMGSVSGSVLGAIVLTILPELLRNFLLLRQVLYGVVIVVMVMYRPAGLLGGFNIRHIRQRILFNEQREKGAAL